MTLTDFILAGVAALAAGIINALAGGGTLITFPVLTALGIPAVVANVTNTVALCPGYLGGTYAQRRDLKGQKKRLGVLIPAGIIGGVAGGFLLLQTGEKIFRELVPYLILFASLILAMQGNLKKWLIKRITSRKPGQDSFISIATIVPSAIYGGYFGAGLGVIILAALGLFIEENLVRLNALKQLISLAVNVAAALFFVFSGKVFWLVAAIMAVSALIGGSIGGKLAGKLKPEILRWVVVTIGIVVSVIYFIK